MYVLDLLGSKRFFVLHVVQSLPPTINWGEPVSKSAVKFCGGVPRLKVVYHYQAFMLVCGRAPGTYGTGLFVLGNGKRREEGTDLVISAVEPVRHWNIDAGRRCLVALFVGLELGRPPWPRTIRLDRSGFERKLDRRRRHKSCCPRRKKRGLHNALRSHGGRGIAGSNSFALSRRGWIRRQRELDSIVLLLFIFVRLLLPPGSIIHIFEMRGWVSRSLPVRAHSYFRVADRRGMCFWGLRTSSGSGT